MLQLYRTNLFHKMQIKWLLPTGLYDKSYLNSILDEDWKIRIQDVIDCQDNVQIKRHPKAGIVKNGKQIMHNGIAITVGGYYGGAIAQMLQKNKGVHEPQEEYAFAEVLKTMREGATMIEFGSYWSFYSIWFNKEIANAKNFMVEPDVFNLRYGINNFKLNKVKGKFLHAFIDKEPGFIDGVPVISVDEFVVEQDIQFIDILHSDIQGFEFKMLLGAINTIKNHKIGYFFISTHGNKVHTECLDFLIENDFQILCEADEKETYSVDGLIVAKSKKYEGLDQIKISLKSK